MAQINQDMSGYDTQEGFEPLKAGWYEAVILDSEIKKGPAGPYINWQFGIVGHPNKVWDVMSLGNSVSMQRLKTLCKCCGHPNPNYLADTEETLVFREQTYPATGGCLGHLYRLPFA